MSAITTSVVINREAIEKFGIDLSDNLDPKLIPTIISEALREITQAKVSEKEKRKQLYFRKLKSGQPTVKRRNRRSSWENKKANRNVEKPN